MDILIKMFYKQNFTLSVNSNECVERTETRIGKKNIYQLIQTGKHGKEGTCIDDCNRSPELLRIVIVTEQIEQKLKEKEILRTNKSSDRNEKRETYRQDYMILMKTFISSL